MSDDFQKLAASHDEINAARYKVLEAVTRLEDAIGHCLVAGDQSLARRLSEMQRGLLQLDFVIPPPIG